MAVKKNLGIYFNEENISIVEVQKQTMLKAVELPVRNSQEEEKSVPEKYKISELIQTALQENNIETLDVNLSIPSKDSLLRSFFIPWMSASEVKGVVEFEAKRYIPFKLENLVYTYYTHTITEEHTKKIQILFIAVKKKTFEYYNQIVEQSGLRINIAEPSAISLLRLLSQTKNIQLKDKVAIILLEETEGNIIIANQHIPEFIRDFRIYTPKTNNEEGVNTSNIIREIRISLDYFARQHKQGAAQQIFVLSQQKNPGLLTALQQALSLEVHFLGIDAFLPSKEVKGLGCLAAYGAAIRKSVHFPVNINLAPKKGAGRLEQLLEEAPFNYALAAKTAGICVGLLMILFVFVKLNVAAYTKRQKVLQDRLGPYESLSVTALKKKKKEAESLLATYKSIRLKSNLSFFLKKIPDMLPKGVWLSNLQITYSDSFVGGGRRSRRRRKSQNGSGKMSTAIAINLDGYAYNKEQQEEITLIYELMQRLKSDPYFSDVLKSIKLEEVRKEGLQDFIVTKFRISLQ